MFACQMSYNQMVGGRRVGYLKFSTQHQVNENNHCMYLVVLYLFQINVLITIPLVDAATSFCLEVTAAEETNELYHLFHLQDHQLFQDLDSRSSWACALLAIFLLSNQTVFHLILSTETRHEIHKVFYNCLSIYVWGDTH